MWRSSVRTSSCCRRVPSCRLSATPAAATAAPPARPEPAAPPARQAPRSRPRPRPQLLRAPPLPQPVDRPSLRTTSSFSWRLISTTPLRAELRARLRPVAPAVRARLEPRLLVLAEPSTQLNRYSQQSFVVRLAAQ